MKTSEIVTEIKNCPKHGMAKHRVIEVKLGGEFQKPISICLFCQQERDKAEREQAEIDRKLSAKGRQEEINKRLDNAMIAPRFAEKTLENFEAVNDGQKEALEAARWLLANLDSGTPGLIFLGNNGTGKNHLASAIVREAVMKHRKTALITKVRKLDRAIKESWRKDGLESEAIKFFILPDLLVIDEVGLQRGSESEILHLSEIIDDRYEAMKPTILCSNLKFPELQALIGDRPVDRFREGGRVLIFDWESYRKKRVSA